jgi:hypothetical protein
VVSRIRRTSADAGAARAGKKNYEDNIVTAEFPLKPDGSRSVPRSDVKTGMIFSARRRTRRAKEFIKFLIKEENLRPYRRRLARSLVPGDEGCARQARSGRPTSIARRSTSSSRMAPSPFQFV